MADFRNEFSWSVSRQGTFSECLRRYFYQYYAYWGGWSKTSDPETREIYILKNLQNRWMWKGGTVHEEIERALKEFRSTGSLPPKTESIKRLGQVMRDGFRGSRAGEYWNKDGSLKDTTALFEHEYKLDVADEVWKQNFAEATTCIENFYASDITADLIREDPKILYIEKLSEFELRGEKIFVKIDLAFRTPDGIDAVDWKTGEGEGNPLQFKVYALYLSTVYELPAERVTVIEYNLIKREKKVHRFTQDELRQTEVEILRVIGEMKALLADPTQNKAEIADFPQTTEEWRCKNCNFNRVCWG